MDILNAEMQISSIIIFVIGALIGCVCAGGFFKNFK